MRKILINSLPKSGTHLLAKGVELFGYKEYFKHDGYVKGSPRFFNYREVKTASKKIKPKNKSGFKINIGALSRLFIDSSILKRWLDMMPDNRYILGHIPWNPNMGPMLAELSCRHLFIIRDPRAVVSSQISFILDSGKMPSDHFLKKDFQEMSREHRLNFILKGGYAKKANVEIKSFAEVYRSMLLWREDPECLFIRFEDLIGEKGGGNHEKQKEIVKRIASHLGLPADSTTPMKWKKIYDPNSRTFATGKIAGWKSAMDAELLSILSEYCKPLCKEAGYGEEY